MISAGQLKEFPSAHRLQAGSRHWSEASSNIRAIWHSDELVVWNRPIVPGVHGSSAYLAVPRMPIAGRGLVIGDFIQRPTMGALEGLSHVPSIRAIVLCIHPARARIFHVTAFDRRWRHGRG